MAHGLCPHTTILRLNQILQKPTTTPFSLLDLCEEVKAVSCGNIWNCPSYNWANLYHTPPSLLTHQGPALLLSSFIFKVSVSCCVPYIVLFYAATAFPSQEKLGTSEKQPSPSNLKRWYPCQNNEQLLNNSCSLTPPEQEGRQSRQEGRQPRQVLAATR